MVIDEKDMTNLFIDKFKKTSLYRVLQSQFEPIEIDTYLENFGHLCCQLGGFSHSEMMIIDVFLKNRLLIDRQLVLIRVIQKRIDRLEAWVVANPSKPERDDKESAKIHILKQKQLHDAHKDIDRAFGMYSALTRR